MTTYQKFEGNFLNPPHKKLNWFNRNYYFASTFIIIALLCVCFFLLKGQLDKIVASDIHWNILLKPLRHAKVGDLVGNIIFFFIISIFLERHFGTMKYFFMVILSFIPSSLAVFAFAGSWAGTGFDGVVFFLLAILLLTLIFNAKGYFGGKCRWIFPIIVLALVAIMCCWDGKSQWPNISVGLGVFTHFLRNWQACAFGGVVGLFAYLFTFQVKKETRPFIKSAKAVKPLKNTKAITKKK